MATASYSPVGGTIQDGIWFATPSECGPYPGQTATINWTITPSGTAVSGTLYVDDLLDNAPPYGQFAADELAAFPYSYTIK